MSEPAHDLGADDERVKRAEAAIRDARIEWGWVEPGKKVQAIDEIMAAAAIAAIAPPVAGSQYLNLPPRRASDKALEIAREAFRNIIATDNRPNAAIAANSMREVARAAFADIEALVPGAATGEGR